jgi:hypothetical protein
MDMPSPFPGMNPYLEHQNEWRNFHTHFINACATALAPQLKSRYFAKIRANTYFQEFSELESMVRDFNIESVEYTEGKRLEPPVYLTHRPPYIKEEIPFIEVLCLETHKRVTVIEVLCPINKCVGSIREQYLASRRHFFAGIAKSNFIEIDLLRGFGRLPMEGLPSCDYNALVYRASDYKRIGCWPIKLRQSLPVLPIPLGDSEPHVTLDLQELLNRVYDEAFLGDTIYKHQPQPPLHPDDDAWARGLIGK